MKGCVTGTADSDLARKGIFRKLGSLMAVALAHQIDVFTGTDNSLTTSVLALLIATEAWSNMENLDDIGVPLPPGFKEVVGRLRENNPRKIGGKNGRNSGQK
jgi:toxin secretion/phage lysis holin